MVTLRLSSHSEEVLGHAAALNRRAHRLGRDHRALFTWVQQRLVEVAKLHGKTVAIDATTL